MKTIGLIGGLTWHSTLDYYRILNELANDRLGGDETAKVIIYSVNFGEIKYLTQKGQWNDIAVVLSKAAQNLEKAGAHCLMIGANTMHKVSIEIEQTVKIPLIHVAKEVANEIARHNIKKVGLLGTKYTMQLPFYKEMLERTNIEVIIPEKVNIKQVDDFIYSELAKGIYTPTTKTYFTDVINQLKLKGAEGIILGCTEIPILLKDEKLPIPVFDTTRIHCQAAIDFVLS